MTCRSTIIISGSNIMRSLSLILLLAAVFLALLAPEGAHSQVTFSRSWRPQGKRAMGHPGAGGSAQGKTLQHSLDGCGAERLETIAQVANAIDVMMQKQILEMS
ncbi:unnamed protein product [Meganyctiphanes norvegica]|uniref:Uncharacterized protein n=1 Tax=Meganyctiphanes norvegica TaxID=48144 RepID=A0AAV2R0E9_MEGNR